MPLPRTSSRRNSAINGIVQGSHFANVLDARQRKVLVAMLKVAYAAGRRHGEDDPRHESD